MQIPADQISYKKRIGAVDSDPVWEVGLKGGLHLVVKAAGGKAETLGVGPHRAVARHIAKKREPKLTITELSKADHVEEKYIEHLIPKYEEVTRAARKIQGFAD